MKNPNTTPLSTSPEEKPDTDTEAAEPTKKTDEDSVEETSNDTTETNTEAKEATEDTEEVATEDVEESEDEDDEETEADTGSEVAVAESQALMPLYQKATESSGGRFAVLLLALAILALITAGLYWWGSTIVNQPTPNTPVGGSTAGIVAYLS